MSQRDDDHAALADYEQLQVSYKELRNALQEIVDWWIIGTPPIRDIVAHARAVLKANP